MDQILSDVAWSNICYSSFSSQFIYTNVISNTSQIFEAEHIDYFVSHIYIDIYFVLIGYRVDCIG